MSQTLVQASAREIREALEGEGRVYLREVGTPHPVRVINARERKGETQVYLGSGVWHTLLNGDDLWAV